MIDQLSKVKVTERAGRCCGVEGIFSPVIVLFPEGRIDHQRFIASRTKKGKIVTVSIRFDDCCENEHETLAITAEVHEGRYVSAGMCHDDIAELFPEFRSLLKWHLCSTDGPLHYIANTVYHAKNGDLDAARRSAIWPEATYEELTNNLEESLKRRLPKLLEEFYFEIAKCNFYRVEELID